MNPGIKSKRIVVLLVMILITVSFVYGQSNLAFYFTRDQFNSSNYNPAYLTSQKKFTFSIFPVAGIDVGYNNPKALRNILKYFTDGKFAYETADTLFTDLLNHRLIQQRMEIGLLSFGYNSEIGSFNFRIKEIEHVTGNLQGQFSEFLINPSSQVIGINQSQRFPAVAMHYREYSVGYAKEIIERKLSVGIRAKLYFGKSSLSSDVEGGLLRYDNKFNLQTWGSLRISAPVEIVNSPDSILRSVSAKDQFTIGSYLMNSGNIGGGIDIGFDYKINSDITFSASLTDFGKIKWESDVNSLIFTGRYDFTNEYIETISDDYLVKKREFSTKTTRLVNLVKNSKDPSVYSISLPANIYAGIDYQVSPKMRIGLVDRFISSKGMNLNSFSLIANYEANKKISFISGYSIIGTSFNNLPFAVFYKWNSGQTFIGTNNVLSFLVPSSSGFSGISFGTCFYLFTKKIKYEDQLEYRPFFEKKKPRPNSSKGLIFGIHPER